MGIPGGLIDIAHGHRASTTPEAYVANPYEKNPGRFWCGCLPRQLPLDRKGPDDVFRIAERRELRMARPERAGDCRGHRAKWLQSDILGQPDGQTAKPIPRHLPDSPRRRHV